MLTPPDFSTGFTAIHPMPFGALGIRTAGGMVTELVYLPPDFKAHKAQDALAKKVVKQVEQYLADADYCFDLPLAPRGTAFQQRVWAAIAAVPRGQVLSYGAVARQIRSGPRAVGQACGANWFPLIIPCHRVVAAQGLGGFARSGPNEAENNFHLGIKRWLLKHEGVEV